MFNLILDTRDARLSVSRLDQADRTSPLQTNATSFGGGKWHDMRSKWNKDDIWLSRSPCSASFLDVMSSSLLL